MGTTRAADGLERDRVGIADLLDERTGIWGPGLLAGDLIHIHPVSSNRSLALFGKVWVSGTPESVGRWTDVEVREEPSAYYIDHAMRSKSPHFFERGQPPLLAPDLSGGRLIGATSQGRVLHAVIKTTGHIMLRTFDVDLSQIRKTRDLYLHPAKTKDDKTVVWDMGISVNGSQVFIFGRDETNALYFSKRDMGRNTHFQYLSLRNWSHLPEDLSPLVSNAKPLISQAPVSMAFDGRAWVISRTFGGQVTFWSTKHPRRGWSLIPGRTETGNVRFQQVTSALDPDGQSKTAVPYSVSREGSGTFPTEIRNFIMPRN